jgi:hypothetical protein
VRDGPLYIIFFGSVFGLVGLAWAWWRLFRGQAVGSVRARSQGEGIIPARARAIVKRYCKGERDVAAVELRIAALEGAKTFTFTPEVARYVAACLEKAVARIRAS